MRSQHQPLEQVFRQALRPTLEDLQHLGPGVGLHLQIMGRSLDQYRQQGINLVRFGIGIGSGCGPLTLADAARHPVQHIGGHRPRGSSKADQRLVRIQRRAHQRQGLAHLLQRLSGSFSPVTHGFNRRHRSQPRAFAGLKPDLLAKGPGDQQYVREDDGCIKAEPPHRLQGRLGRLFGRQAKGDEIRRRCPQRPVFRQIPTGLAHKPDRRPGGRLTVEDTKKHGARHASGFTGRAGFAQASAFPTLLIKELKRNGGRRLDRGRRG